MERDVANSIYERFLREFMDIVILTKMREEETSGYDMLTYFHHKLDFLVSPSTVYSVLYSMERNGLIGGRENGRKRIYTLTLRGEAVIKAINQSNGVLKSFLEQLLRARESIVTQIT
jgi:DNA-binding PadR family transcriptional regulator